MRLSFPSVMHASSGKVMDPILTPLVTSVSIEGGQFSTAKKSENVFLTLNQPTSDAAID